MQQTLHRLGVLDAFGTAVQLDLLGNPLDQVPTANSAQVLEQAYQEQGNRIAYCKPLIST